MFKKKISILTFTLSVFVLFLVACESENLLPNSVPNNTTSNTTNTSSKNCLPTTILMKEGAFESKMTYAYNAKNLIEKFSSEGLNLRFEYDNTDKISKLIDLEDPNYFDELIYDSKGNLTEIKVFGTDENGKKVGPFSNKITLNAIGNISKINYSLEAFAKLFGGDLDPKVLSTDLSFEYDNANNLKKITTIDKNKKVIVLVENTAFDTKFNPFSKSTFQKAFIFEIITLAFFGEDLTYMMSKNNPTQTKIMSILGGEPILIDYKYDTYTSGGFPEKYSKSTKVLGNNSRVDWSVVYNCK